MAENPTLIERLIALRSDAVFTCRVSADGMPGTILRSDGGLARLCGLNPAETPDLCFAALFPGADARGLAETLATRGAAQGTFTLAPPGRDSRPVDLAAVRDGGQAVFSLALRAEATASDSQRLRTFEAAFLSAPLPRLLTDEHGRILEASRTAERLFGYSRDELQRLSWADLDPASETTDAAGLWRSLTATGGCEFESVLRDRDGRRIPVEIGIAEVRLDAARYHVVHARDLSLRKQLEEERRDAEATLRSIFDGVYDAIFLHDLEGRILDVNAQAPALYGVDREALLAMSIPDDLSDADNPLDDLPTYWALALGGRPQFFEWKARRPGNGEAFDVEVFLRRIPYGRRDVIMANVRDISRRKEYERRIKLAAKVFENTMEGISITAPDGTILAVNPAFSKITGYAPQEVVGQNPRVLKSDRHDAAFYAAMWQSIGATGHWEGEIWNRRKSGEAYPERLAISAVKDLEGRVESYVAVFHDITEIKETQEQMRHQAYHDFLTGLPNRLLLKDRIRKAVAHMARTGSKLGVLFLDIDNFKTINDSLGHAAGDLLIQAVGQRLTDTVREQDTVARLGGDEFVIMIEDLESPEQAMATAGRVLESLRAPFALGPHELHVTTSIGAAFFPDDGSDPDTLIKNADLALYRAKEQGKDNLRLYTPAMNERAVRRMSLERDLRKAIESDEIVLYYQPKVRLADGKVTGAEALARWRKADGTVISPAEFIPLAEETGLIIPMGARILAEACGAARRWREAGLGDLRVAVNVSGRQFREADLKGSVARILAASGLPPELLEVELTESILVHDVDKAMSVLGRLRDMGVRSAVDDFGTGYSSLAYLKRFPLGTLKIDKSFIDGVPAEPNDIAITTAIISMAHSMDLEVVAEGVESVRQLTFLMGLRCDAYQGYHFSPPVPEERFMELARRAPAG